MERRNKVFIATSLDGYIADNEGNTEWLHSIPNPDNIDMGYGEFMAQTDAVVIGRTTYETVMGFGIGWPYKKPVFVLSNTIPELPKVLMGKAFLLKGDLKYVLDEIHEKKFYKLYIDGGKVIQCFLKEDLIDEIIITIIPVLLGGGTPLFSDLPQKLDFECIDSKILLNKIVQNHFKRLR